MREYHCEHALLPDGWRSSVRLRVGPDGRWDDVRIDQSAAGATRIPGLVLPGMPNLHSHAFQRAMAGSAERFGRPDDSFWSWRESMYRFAGAIDPDSLYAIAAWLYVEMLERGYTRVCEFHYVHHASDGSRHATASAMSDALIAAANDTGIGLTLLPTFYQRGGFRAEPLVPRQLRFAHRDDEFAALLDGLAARSVADDFRLGVAIHSLRAVGAEPMRELLGSALLRSRPIHIHVAEQQREVEDCVAVHGRRPVDYLFDQVDVDARYCLVHATHTTPDERARMAQSGAVAGLCPTTEGNLGDGLFPIEDWRLRGGIFGIGSDSQIGLDPREELRWLEYQARLSSGRRTVLADATHADVAANLWTEAVAGGARASGASGAGFVVGADADWIAIDRNDPALDTGDPESMLAAWLFGPSRAALGVGVQGSERVIAGNHPARERFANGYKAALARLRSNLD